MFVEDVIIIVGDVVVSVSLIILVDSVFVGLDMGVVSTWAFEKTLNSFVSYVRKKLADSNDSKNYKHSNTFFFAAYKSQVHTPTTTCVRSAYGYFISILGYWKSVGIIMSTKPVRFVDWSWTIVSVCNSRSNWIFHWATDFRSCAF